MNVIQTLWQGLFHKDFKFGSFLAGWPRVETFKLFCKYTNQWVVTKLLLLTGAQNPAEEGSTTDGAWTNNVDFGHEVLGVPLYMPFVKDRCSTISRGQSGFLAWKTMIMMKMDSKPSVMRLTVSFCSTGTKVFVVLFDSMRLLG